VTATVTVMPTQSVTGMIQTIEAEVRQLTSPQKCRVIEGCGRLPPTRFQGLARVHAVHDSQLREWHLRPAVRGYQQPWGVGRSNQHEGPCFQPLVQ
jgi:hypothetical protein